MRQWAITTSPRSRCEVSALLDSLQGYHGGYGNPAENLLDTCRVAIIVDCLTLKQPAGILAFARMCSDAGFGFRLVTVGSANSLAVVLAGIGLFNLCDVDIPRERSATIRNYIALCQTIYGGFGRAPSAIATLEDTWWALDALQNQPEL